MHRLEEMLRVQTIDQIVGQPVVDHHRAQQRGLRLDIAGKLLRLGGGSGVLKC